MVIYRFAIIILADVTISSYKKDSNFNLKNWLVGSPIRDKKNFGDYFVFIKNLQKLKRVGTLGGGGGICLLTDIFSLSSLIGQCANFRRFYKEVANGISPGRKIDGTSQGG